MMMVVRPCVKRQHIPNVRNSSYGQYRCFITSCSLTLVIGVDAESPIIIRNRQTPVVRLIGVRRMQAIACQGEQKQ